MSQEAETRMQVAPRGVPDVRLEQVLAKLGEFRQSIDQDKERIKAQAPTTEQLHQELGRTVFPMLADLTDLVYAFGVYTAQFTDWTVQGHQTHADALDDLTERTADVEDMVLGDRSQLTASDHELFTKVALGLEVFAERLLSDATFTSTEAKQKVEEGLALSKQMQARLNDIEIIEPEGGDGDEDGDDDDDDAEDADESDDTAS